MREKYRLEQPHILGVHDAVGRDLALTLGRAKVRAVVKFAVELEERKDAVEDAEVPNPRRTHLSCRRTQEHDGAIHGGAHRRFPRWTLLRVFLLLSNEGHSWLQLLGVWSESHSFANITSIHLFVSLQDDITIYRQTANKKICVVDEMRSRCARRAGEVGRIRHQRTT